MSKVMSVSLTLVIFSVASSARLEMDKVLVLENSPLGELLKDLRTFARQEIGSISQDLDLEPSGVTAGPEHLQKVPGYLTEHPESFTDGPNHSKDELESLRKEGESVGGDSGSLSDELTKLLGDEATEETEYLTYDDEDPDDPNDPDTNGTEEVPEEPEYYTDDQGEGAEYITKGSGANLAGSPNVTKTTEKSQNLTTNVGGPFSKVVGSYTEGASGSFTKQSAPSTTEGGATGVIVPGQPCNTLNNSTKCTLRELIRYGCCPSPPPSNPMTHSCNISSPCPPHFKCTMHDEMLPFRVRGARLMMEQQWWKCQLINPYQNVTLQSMRSRKGRPRLGQPCNRELYEMRMEPIWDKYLKCPWDPEPFELFEQLKKDWLVNHEIMNQVCLSHFIEACGPEGTCQCFSKVFTDHTGQVVMDFRQVMESDGHCRLKRGSVCSHAGGSQCGHLRSITRDFVANPEPFECAAEAYCEVDERTKQCPLGQTCRCKCAPGFPCEGKGSRVYGKILILVLVFSYLIPF